MKQLKNWRYWIIYTLFSVGFFSLLLIFSDDNRALAEWIEIRCYLAIITIASFYTLNRLRVRWESSGKIDKFLNPKYY